jgi:glycosyltransferase involved in cell wall biosynthesis
MGIRLLAHLDPRPSFAEKARRMRDALLHRPAAFPKDVAASTIVHCPYQMVHPMAPKTWDLPYVIHLHDIQHEHYPEFFSPEELAWRREHYLASANQAMAVCVIDAWTRRDLLSHLPIPEDKVFVAPYGPTWSEDAASQGADWPVFQRERGLPQAFAYYPAQTWIHKNHARLFEALHQLAGQGIRIPLVCSGHLTERHPELARMAESLGLEVHFLGLVKGEEVRALYNQARMVISPTLFEAGAGFPVLESMALGVPLVASRACGIPDAVGDTALLFDPLDPGDMAQAIGRLWGDGELRETLARRAQARSRLCTWEGAAATYRDIYTEVLARWKARPKEDPRP